MKIETRFYTWRCYTIFLSGQEELFSLCLEELDYRYPIKTSVNLKRLRKIF